MQICRGKVAREHRTLDTTADGLPVLPAFLQAGGCGVAAMEAAGVCRMPVWRISNEGGFAPAAANPARIKAVPGRKTDVNDAARLADLAAFGPIGASFAPGREFRELRALARTRKQLAREQVRHVRRIRKTLAEADIRLDGATGGIMGAGGRRRR